MKLLFNSKYWVSIVDADGLVLWHGVSVETILPVTKVQVSMCQMYQ